MGLLQQADRAGGNGETVESRAQHSDGVIDVLSMCYRCVIDGWCHGATTRPG